MSSYAEILEECERTLCSDFLLDAIHDFRIESQEDIREMGDATSLPEAKRMVVLLIKRLTEIALEAIRIVRWSKAAKDLRDKLRLMLDTQSGMDLVYRYQHEKAMADYEVGGGSMIKRPGSFKLKILSEFDPRLYEMYLNNVSNLTTLHDEFKVKPKILIATQAILFGKQACALANILYNIIQDSHANDMRGLCIQFTYTLLLAPVILHPSLIIQISNDNPLRREVWGHLGEMGYSDEQLAAFKRYHLVVVDSIFDSSCAVCAFALLSHNVFVPASPEDPHELSNMIVMQHIEVRAAHQRCGIGGFLARAIRKIARGNGYHSIYVPETPQMQATANFWKCLGFKKSLFYEGWHALLLQGEQQLTSALA